MRLEYAPWRKNMSIPDMSNDIAPRPHSLVTAMKSLMDRAIVVKKTLFTRKDYVLVSDLDDIFNRFNKMYRIVPRQESTVNENLLIDYVGKDLHVDMEVACAECMERPNNDCDLCDGDVFVNETMPLPKSTIRVINKRIQAFYS